MSPAPSRPEPTDRATERDEDASYYREVLHELVAMATGIARVLHRQATAEPAAPEGQPAPAQAPTPDPAIAASTAFDRIARTIRRTIALARKLAEPAQPGPALASQRRLSARKRLIRGVEDAIQRETRGAEAAALNAELSERLDGPDLDDDLAQLPIAEVIAIVCRDLGIAHVPGTHPWKRRTPQDVRDLCARAARPPRADTRADAGNRTGDPRPFPAPPPRARPGTGPPAP